MSSANQGSDATRGLQGRTVLVTGAARGIGAAIARVLAAAGADLAVLDVDGAVEETAAAVRQAGRRAAVALLDITDAAQVRAGIEAVTEELGPVDVLVNNAGIVNNVAPLDKMDPAAWEREIAVNLGGAFHMSQAVLPAMVERRWGRIINISSVAAEGGLHYQAGYAASKAGLLGLTKTVALEYARHGITCNAILPGLIETEGVRAMPDEIRHAVASVAPARRLGEVGEVAHLVAFIASDEAGYINGATINIDGGLRLNTTSLASRREIRETQGRG